MSFLIPLTSNEITLKDRFAFVSEICAIPKDENYTMASFDVKSLFTNIPINETIDTACDTLFDPDRQFGTIFSKNYFKQLLELATKGIIFLFNNKQYSQEDGAAMGRPLAPTFANLFLCHHEKLWLDNNCPSEFKLVLYRRYVDDTFLLYKRPHHVQLFLNYLNSQHPNIEFTAEIEENSKLSFLDVTLSKDHGMFVTSVYRKSTFTGLGMKFTFFVPLAFKINLISCLIIKSFKICSSSFSFNLELSFIK